jgi:predicted MFS family arabinose efflux permease
MAVGLVMLGAGSAAIVAPSTWLLCAAAAVVGVAVPWMMVAFTTLRQRLTPGALQGRVAAATNMALNGPQTAGTALGAALITVVDYRLLGLVMAVTIAACAVPTLGSDGGSRPDLAENRQQDPGVATDSIAAPWP